MTACTLFVEYSVTVQSVVYSSQVMASAEGRSILANIVNLKSQLSDIIEPEFGLLDHLLRLEVLTRRQYNIIRAGDKAACERSEALLDLIVSEEQCGKLLEALRVTAQQHIVNLITENGGKKK